jgi:hypothetical protein
VLRLRRDDRSLPTAESDAVVAPAPLHDLVHEDRVMPQASFALLQRQDARIYRRGPVRGPGMGRDERPAQEQDQDREREQVQAARRVGHGAGAGAGAGAVSAACSAASLA